MLRKIKLYGHLREHTGLKEVEAYVDSVRDAVNFLTCNWPTLEPQIVQNNYHVLLDEDDVGEEELLYPIGNASISFIPVVEGSGKFGKILAGAALIGLGMATGGITFASFFNPAVVPFAPGFASAGFLTKATIALGGSLVLGGVSDLLTPTPQIPGAEQTPESSAFTSPLNVSMPGIAVPLVYGTAICGSIVVSTSIEVGNV